VQADVRAVADRRHRLRLGEHFGVGADAHFHVLRPGAAFDELLLELFRFRRTRLDRRQVGADILQQRGAQFLGAAGVAAGLLFDHAFQQADRECDAASLEGLHVARRQQTRRLGVGITVQGIFNQRLHTAQRLARRRTRERGDVFTVEQVGHGADMSGDVEYFAVAYRDHARAIDIAGAPYAAYQQGVGQVGRQVGGGWRVLQLIAHDFSYVS
jgi:hypothetical protein